MTPFVLGAELAEAEEGRALAVEAPLRGLDLPGDPLVAGDVADPLAREREERRVVLARDPRRIAELPTGSGTKDGASSRGRSRCSRIRRSSAGTRPPRRRRGASIGGRRSAVPAASFSRPSRSSAGPGNRQERTARLGKMCSDIAKKHTHARCVSRAAHAPHPRSSVPEERRHPGGEVRGPRRTAPALPSVDVPSFTASAAVDLPATGRPAASREASSPAPFRRRRSLSPRRRRASPSDERRRARDPAAVAPRDRPRGSDGPSPKVDAQRRRARGDRQPAQALPPRRGLRRGAARGARRRNMVVSMLLRNKLTKQ